MPFSVLQATFWDHGGTTFTPVERPSWDAIAGEMAKKRSATLAGAVADPEKPPTAFGTLTLQRHAAGWLVVGTPVGGSKAAWLIDPNRSRMPASMGCCGGARVPGKYLVPDALAVTAAKQFFIAGSFGRELVWADEPPG
jgi:hypothetical protein